MTQQFRRLFSALSQTVAAPVLHRLMFLFFLRRGGHLPAGRDALRRQLGELPRDEPVDEPSDATLTELVNLFNRFDWRLEDEGANGALTPRVLADTFEQSVNRRQTGTYYTGRDVTGYIARATILPHLLDEATAGCPGALAADGWAWLLPRDDPERYIPPAVRHGIDRPPPEGGVGRAALDRPVPPEFALPAETWREHLARRRYGAEVRRRLRAGAVRTPDDLVTWNLDTERFAHDLIARPDGTPLAHALHEALRGLTVLDPTCGCGDFLLAALDLLAPLYAACLGRLGSPPRPAAAVEAVLRCLLGVDVMPEAAEVCRLRLWLRLAAASDGPVRLDRLPDLAATIRAGDVLAGLEWRPARGFGVVIGNPPYVEAATFPAGPAVRDYHTAGCGNLYAWVVERALRLLAPGGRLGVIVPHSAVCTDRMAPLLRLLTEGAVAWVSTYDIRPCKLFAGVDQRLAICLRRDSPRPRTYSTRYHRWHEAERPHLFENLRYLDVGGLRYDNSLPKAGDPIEERVWHKLHARRPLAADLGGGAVVHYHNAPRYWVRALTFAPFFWNERDGAKLSAQVKALAVRDAADAAAVTALLNSSLFCWWWLLLSDCRHLNRREIERFPAGLAEMSRDVKRKLNALCRRLMADYRRHAVRKVCRYRTTGKVVYDEFYPGRSKAILDEIDRVLGGHYGLAEDEVDFLVHHDVKYRSGPGPTMPA
jgi:hypothetical protein